MPGGGKLAGNQAHCLRTIGKKDILFALDFSFVYSYHIDLQMIIFLQSFSGQSTPDTEMDGTIKTNTKFRKAVFSILKSLQDPSRSKLQADLPTASGNNSIEADQKKINENVVKSPTIEEEKESFTDSEAMDDSLTESIDSGQKPQIDDMNKLKEDDEIDSPSLDNKDFGDTVEDQKEPCREGETTQGIQIITSKQEEGKMPHPGVIALKMQHLGSKKAPSMTPTFPQNLSHLHNPSEAGGRGSNIHNTPHLYTSTPGIRPASSFAGGLRSTRFAERARTTIIRRRSANTIRSGERTKEEDENESSFYLSWVARSCVVLQLWFHPILLELLPIPILYCITKWVFSKFDLLDPLLSWINDAKETLLALIHERSDALAPRPVRSIWRQLYKLEKKVLVAAPAYTDVIVTALLIVACNTFVICFIFYVTFQLYTESVVLMQLSSTVMSKITHTSLYQNINETIVGKCMDSGVEACAYVLPTGNYSNVDQLVESAYQYGRNYISSAISSFLRDTSDNSHQDAQLDQFENQVLELWDRLYQYWLNKNNELEATNQEHNIETSPNEVFGPKVTSGAVTSSMEDLFSGMLNASVPTRVFGNAMNFSMFSQFAMNNIGTMTSVLDQGWTLIKGNLGLVFTVIAECLRILLSGGSGMVNFCLSLIVYFTALFYLLRSKDPIYKPIEVISNHGQLLGSGFASALEKAVNGVFTLTVKMVCFYGMWTYLTHMLFAVSLVTLPVLAAAFLAAVPVAGQYVVAIPAALELWLAESRWFAAMLIILAHVIPTYVVDAAIYSEARQDIHPWITGLSIIGGVYWCGVPGAIYGPLLLCAVYVILSMYTSLLKEIPLEANTLHRTTGMERKSKVGQSLLCGVGSKTAHQTPILKRSDSVF